MVRRENQRARTRQALIEATAELMAQGSGDPSMDQIAEAARVSRATAYRYFDSPADAVWQAVSDREMADLDTSMNRAGDDVVTRVLVAEEVINGYLFSDPDGTRAFERAALDRHLRGVATDDDRAARRLLFIDAALGPIATDLPPDDLSRVRHALALTMGSQVVPALLDTCRLDIDEARRVTRFACETIATEAVKLAAGNSAPVAS